MDNTPESNLKLNRGIHNIPIMVTVLTLGIAMHPPKQPKQHLTILGNHDSPETTQLFQRP